MKDKTLLRQLAVFFALFSLFIVFALGGQFSAHAASFQEHYLSSDGGVKASYNDATQGLNIYGAGTVEYDRWVAMAQKVNSGYYGDEVSWSAYTDEDGMTISFSGSPKAIKLCGTEETNNGLFTNYSGKISFNGAVDLTPSATDISDMFSGTKQFNQPVDFNTSNVTDMSYMFWGADSFNQALNFDTSSVTNMAGMFWDAKSFNQSLSFDTSNVMNVSYMFSGADSFNQALNFDTSNVTNMEAMFADATAFKQAIELDVSSLTNMNSMFKDSAIEYVVLKHATAAQSIDASHAFLNCPGLKYSGGLLRRLLRRRKRRHASFKVGVSPLYLCR